MGGIRPAFGHCDCLLAPVHALGLPVDRRVKTLPRPHRSPLCARAGQSPNIQRLHSRCSGRDDAAMPVPTRPQKIALADMRAAGVRGLLIYCSDYHCSHWTAISGDQWPDDVRLSDLETRFTFQARGRRGADARPHLQSADAYA
jgi:hypothetical protein